MRCGDKLKKEKPLRYGVQGKGCIEKIKWNIQKLKLCVKSVLWKYFLFRYKTLYQHFNNLLRQYYIGTDI